MTNGWRHPSIAAVVIAISLTCSSSEAQVVRQIAQRALSSVVLLVMADPSGQPVALGSGFFVRQGVVATNYHVIEGAASGYAKGVGQQAKHDILGVVAADGERDLALLSVAEQTSKALPLGDSTKAAVGDKVYAVGNPRGLEGTFSEGIMSGIRQIGPDTVLQITAPISPGSSGGPVLDSEGKAIGVATATYSGGQNLNFAIPASYLTPMLANTHPVRPLSAASAAKRESVFGGLGGRSTDGVVGAQLTWKYDLIQPGDYAFSLRNQLRTPVRKVYCLVIFYDSVGQPIDVDAIERDDVIPPGLAKRVTSRVDSSVQQLTTPSKGSTPDTRVEFRVLDFQVVD